MEDFFSAQFEANYLLNRTSSVIKLISNYRNLNRIEMINGLNAWLSFKNG